jgi:O-antigen ligase
VSAQAAQRVGAVDRGVTAQRGVALGTALVVFVPVAALAGAQGGYFPSSWGWVTLPLLWIAAVTLALRRHVRLSIAERTYVGLLAALVTWILLSALWSPAPANSILEAQRALIYAAAVTAALVAARSRFVWHLLAGVLAGVTVIAAFSLATRLFPDRVGVFESTAVNRLSQPIGYWNGLGAFCAMGTLLAVGFSARGRSLVSRAAGAGALVVLLPTLHFTFGRGAWLALIAGLAAAVAFDTRRLQLIAALLVLAPSAVAAVVLAAREPGLTNTHANLANATHDGHHLALLLLLLLALNVVLAIAFASAEKQLHPDVTVRRAFAAVVSLAVVVVVAAVFVRYDGPVRLVERGYDAFKAPPPHAVDLNRRLLSFSGNGRADLWRIAWNDAKAHPMTGAGAGMYERYFLAHQPADVSRVRDAHGLYIETLAELGIVGLMLLLAALAVPLAVIPRARSHPLLPAALGAYVVYLVHAAADWDWELPAVTLVGLFAGVALLVAARTSFHVAPASPRLRWSAVAVAVIVSCAVAIALTGNMALSRSNKARSHEAWVAAANDARTAQSWMPWSPAPWVALGRAQLGAGFVIDARKSFRKAVSMDLGDWELWYRLAGASRGAERQRALREAARLYPRSGLMRLGAGRKATSP